MAKTAAERQKVYRASRQFAGEDGNGERRINTWVSTRAALALDRLAASYGVTKREMLERLVINEEEKVLKKIRLDNQKGRRTYPDRSYAVTNKKKSPPSLLCITSRTHLVLPE